MWLVGRYDDALAAFARLHDQAGSDADRIEAGIGAARCRLQQGQYREALDGLLALPSAREQSAAWHTAVADVQRVFGDYDRVLEHARAAIALDKRSAGPRRLLAETLEYLGRRDEAIEAYEWFNRQMVDRPELPSDAEWLTDAAHGFYRYTILTRTDIKRRTRYVLVELLQNAYERVDRTWWPARVAAADLLRAKYNDDEEDGSVSDYAAALRINENLPQAYVGLGAVALDRWDFEDVERKVATALGINPNFAPAHNLLAHCRLQERRYDETVAEAQKALELNPNDIEALSLQAAARLCQYDQPGVDSIVRRVEALNPRCAMLYRLLGDATGGIRQYEASERHYEKAIEFDPTDANARTELGMMYMQWGLEEKARAALDGAWALDPYNERTYNTLELLDSLEAFQSHETEHFEVRFDETLDPGLGAYVATYLESIYPQVTGDYDMDLEHKTIIEIFPTHKQFGVRITGKPWIHTVGACTGRVIALDSPRRHPALDLGPYNLASVLKHEFTHTVTLAATENRIPHWLTEGLAVWQEDHPRTFDWMRMLAERVRRGELFTLEEINWGFARPRRPDDRQVAYAQSEWMCEFLIERWGYDIINQMLKRFRERQTQAEVFKELLGIEPVEFDRQFEPWARAQVASWGFSLNPPDAVEPLREAFQEEPENADAGARLARAELDAGNDERALGTARKVLALDEDSVEALSVACSVLFDVRLGERSSHERAEIDGEAEPLLRRLANRRPEDWVVHKFLGLIALDAGDLDRAERHFLDHQRVCPYDPASYSALAGIYLKRGNDDAALPQLLELAQTDEHDPDTFSGLARIYVRRGALPDAANWFERALMIDPFSVQLHEELARVKMQLGDTAGALREYRMLTQLEPHKSSHFANGAAAAHKAGLEEVAAEMARKAVELDPTSPAKALLP